LTLNLKADDFERLKSILDKQSEIEAYSPRIKFGGMFSNFVETTNIRLVAVYPDREFATVPLLPSRISGGEKTLKRGEILIPDLLAKGMNVKVGDTVVVVATNKDGSVNGRQFKIAGVVEGISPAPEAGTDISILKTLPNFSGWKRWRSAR
jgi:putative ABC transport system permease protein